MEKLKLSLYRIISTLVLFVALFVLDYFLTFNKTLKIVLYAFVYLIIAYDVIFQAVKNITRGKVFDENFLMCIASICAFVVGDYAESVAVVLFYQIGELFQKYAVGKSRKSISSLMKIKPEKANILKDGKEFVVDPCEVLVGDIIIVKNGEKVPVDGVIAEGVGCFDVAALTGESMPKDCRVGDEVLSGSINIGNVVKIKCEKEYYDSTVSKILDLVENVSGKKAKAENFITKFARFYTPTVVFCALILFLIPSLITKNWSVWLIRACTFLVVSCPCALVISIPLGFFGGIGGASKSGILVKGGNYLELLKDADTFVFDKTGTLTKGNFEIIKTFSNTTEQELLSLAATCECGSNHPIAKCILSVAKPIKGYAVSEISGKGILAKSGEDIILCGNSDLLNEYNVNHQEIHSDFTTVYVSHNGNYIGYITLGDSIKPNAKEVITKLNDSDYKTVMFTGDNKNSALNVAKKVGVKECFYELLPTEKVGKLEEILKVSKGKVVFVGDGINDAPVLMRADIGISMGGVGSDSAIEASDMVLMYDDLSAILKAKEISKKTVNIVRQNIVFALFVKLAVLVLSAFGLTGMWAAVFADVGVAVIAILNSMRTLKLK